MNYMQQVMQQIQKTQREYDKAHKLLEEKEFTYTASDAIKVTMKGDLTLVSVEFIDEEILEKDNADMISDMIKVAYTHIKEQIDAEEEEIADKFKNTMPRGMGF